MMLPEDEQRPGPFIQCRLRVVRGDGTRWSDHGVRLGIGVNVGDNRVVRIGRVCTV